MKTLCIWLIRLYQRFLSPLKGRPTCRFTPTCSQYAIDAFSKRGFFVGMILSIWRILRCNPFCAPGYDPVPDHGFGTHGKGIDSPSINDIRQEYVPPLICPDYMARLPRRSHPNDKNAHP